MHAAREGRGKMRMCAKNRPAKRALPPKRAVGIAENIPLNEKEKPALVEAPSDEGAVSEAD